MPSPSHTAAGLAYGLGAYLLWGFLPLYFRALHAVPPLVVLAHRVVGSVAVLALWLALRGGLAEAGGVLREPRKRRAILASAAFISVNWGLYIWAVHEAHVLEASLGYFVNPLVNVLLGVAFLGERLTRAQKIAIALAGAGVLVLLAGLGRLPWIALVLAVSFGFYGLVRKTAGVGAAPGLLVETALLAPVAVAFLGAQAARGAPAAAADLPTNAVLALAGLVTTVPLVWFTLGVQRLRLATMGLLQYVAPTLQFLIAVFVFGEPFTRAHAVAFPLIWASIALYTWDSLARAHRAAQAAAAPGAAAGAP
jgi:chloramphenicol-sensitive protein RarD